MLTQPCQGANFGTKNRRLRRLENQIQLLTASEIGRTLGTVKLKASKLISHLDRAGSANLGVDGFGFFLFLDDKSGIVTLKNPGNPRTVRQNGSPEGRQK